MQSIDLSTYNIGQLKELQSQVETAIVRAEKKKYEVARDQILGIAHSLGLPVQALLVETGLVKDGFYVKPPKAVKKAPTKYRNPEKPVEVWSGRGRQPGWVKQYLEQNPTKSLNDIEVE